MTSILQLISDDRLVLAGVGTSWHIQLRLYRMGHQRRPPSDDAGEAICTHTTRETLQIQASPPGGKFNSQVLLDGIEIGGTRKGCWIVDCCRTAAAIVGQTICHRLLHCYATSSRLGSSAQSRHISYCLYYVWLLIVLLCILGAQRAMGEDPHGSSPAHSLC
jgi:hypothetical protein